MKTHPTIIMEKTLTSITLGLAGLVSMLAPASALAYLSPDQVFGGASSTLQPAPPTPRESSTVVEQQQQRTAEQRASAQSVLRPVDAEPQDRYVPETQSLGLFNNDVQYEKRMNRIEEKKSGGPTIVIGGDGTVVDANGNVLRSGAPRVSSTGPESVLAVTAIILAGVCTFVFAQYRSRKLLANHTALS